MRISDLAAIVRRNAPELGLAVFAGLTILAFLGSPGIWGKREQRAAAEALDTLAHDHWLVAEIQCRPRLEKPPLPRWTIAGLMTLTGRRDEWVVRLPSALSALGMIALTYALGRSWARRSVGVVSGLVLTSMIFFVLEMRQAGNDGMLAFFTTLALFAAWRVLRADRALQTADSADPAATRMPSPRWMYLALGLGALCKGPIILVIAGLTVVSFLLITRRARAGLKDLWDPLGLVVMLILGLAWPVSVVLNDPNAARVWYLEMAMKTGAAGIAAHKSRQILAGDWAMMTAPWPILGLFAVLLPFWPRPRANDGTRPLPGGPGLWFFWSWAVLNLVMFCFWSVAKSNYYLPCLPAVAILCGWGWLQLAREARDALPPRRTWASAGIFGHWALIGGMGAVVPAVLAWLWPEHRADALVIGLAFAAGVAASIWAWRRRWDEGTMFGLAGANVVMALVAYGSILPRHDGERAHRALAAELDRRLPPDARTVLFFHEIDEGLWFYLRDHELRPVPGSQPRYNDAFDLDATYRHLDGIPAKEVERQRLAQERKRLLAFLAQPPEARDSDYILLKVKTLAMFLQDPEFGRALRRRATVEYKEPALERNELVLLRARPDLYTQTAPADRHEVR